MGAFCRGSGGGWWLYLTHGRTAVTIDLVVDRAVCRRMIQCRKCSRVILREQRIYRALRAHDGDVIEVARPDAGAGGNSAFWY